MKFRVDKLGTRDFTRPDFGHTAFEKKYRQEPIKINVNKFDTACYAICEQCATEIYGAWGGYKLSLSKEDFDWGRETEWALHSKHRPQDVVAKEKKISYEFEELKDKYEQFEQECKGEYEKIKNMKSCPICGYPIKMEHIFAQHGAIYWDNALLDSKREYRKKNRQSKILMQADQDTIRFRKEECDFPVYGLDKTIGEKIKKDPELLKQYCQNINQINENISTMWKRLRTLYEQRYEIEDELKPLQYLPIYEMKLKMAEDQEKYDCAEDKYHKQLKELEKCRNEKPAPVTIPEPLKPCVPNYEKPGFFNKKKVMEKNEALEKEYTLALREYEDECEQRKKEIEQQTKIAEEQYLRKVEAAKKAVDDARLRMERLRVIPEKYSVNVQEKVYPEKLVQQMLNKEIAETEQLYKKLFQTRNELYGYNVIAKKYQNSSAVSAFYDYLLIGRCETLEGAAGAYNLYESEMRFKEIGDNFDTIHDDLGRLERGQRKLSSKLDSMGRSLDRLDQKMGAAHKAISDMSKTATDIYAETKNMNVFMERLSKNSDVIAHNTAVTAYYSKINAELTDALGFMVALK